MAKRSRTRYWIDRQIQGALATRVAIHWCVFAAFAVVLTLLMQYVGDPFASWSEHVHNVWRNQGAFGIVMLILMPVFLYDTVKLSNRFAGPVLRLRRVMNQIAEGKPAERLTFRSGDFWSGMAQDFNTLIDRGYFSDSSPQEAEDTELQEVG